MTRHQFDTYTYNQALDAYHSGAWTDHDWRAYLLAWTWSNMRFGGAAGIRQERCFTALGYDGLLRRRARAARLADQFAATLR
jgi:hypothetical protein